MNESHKERTGGFSLVEVVIAVGLFALSILAVVGLLGPILESVRESEETEIVSNLNELIRAELERIPFESDDSGDPAIEDLPSGPDDVAVLYASRDLSLVAPAGDGGQAWEDYLDDFEDRGLADTFFRIELRNPEAFPFGPARNVPADEEASRTFHIRVFWPIYRRTGPGPDDAVPAVDDYEIGALDPEGLSELRQMNFFTTIRRK